MSQLQRIVVKRVLMTLPLLFLIATLIFAASYLVPGDPAAVAAGPDATAADIAHMRTQLGLDQNALTRYVDYMGGLLHGDLGTSYTGQDVRELIVDRLPQTLSLAVGALLLGALVGVPVGVFAARRRGGVMDRMVIATTSLGVATPSYWLAIVLVTLFAVKVQIFPVTGFVPITESVSQWAWHLVLPWIALGALIVADLARQTRASMIGVLDMDYVRTARMKGLAPRTVVYKHALKNAAVPVTSSFSLHVISALSGAVFIEAIFSIFGLGDLAISSVVSRDMPTIQGIALLSVLIVVGVNLVTDLFLLWVNPRMRVA